MQITTIGLDIAKNVFQVHGIGAAERVSWALALQIPRPFRRRQLRVQNLDCIQGR
jgi:hypothetical protein